MNFLIYGAKSFCRRRGTSILISALFFFISLALMLSSLVVGVCDLYRSRNENPYSDYYRLLVDRRSDDIYAITGYTGYASTNKMYSGSWGIIKEINDNFYNITDFTAEAYGQTTASIDPLLPEWLNDSGIFLLYGSTKCTELTEFTRGELTLTAGRLLVPDDRYNKSNVCMLSEEVASLNDISVGDSIDIRMSKEVYEPFTVVGIYRINTAYSKDGIRFSYNLPENRIFVPLSTFERAYCLGCYNYQIKLDDASLIGQVEELVNKYAMGGGFPAYFIRVGDIFEANNRGVRSLERVFEVTQLIFAATAAILCMIIVFSLVSSRKKEYGIYLAMGNGKAGIAGALSVELGLTMTVGILLAFAAVMICGSDISNSLLAGSLGNISAESLAITTSDSVMSLSDEIAAVYSLTDSAFVADSIGKALILILPCAVIAVICAFAGIFRISTMKLLTNQE